MSTLKHIYIIEWAALCILLSNNTSCKNSVTTICALYIFATAILKHLSAIVDNYTNPVEIIIFKWEKNPVDVLYKYTHSL